MKHVLFFVLICFFPGTALTGFAQPVVKWSLCIGGPGKDFTPVAWPMAGDRFIVTGSLNLNGKLRSNVYQLDDSGNIIDTATYSWWHPLCISPTRDGGFLSTGDGMARLDASGIPEWFSSGGHCAQEMPNGNIAVCGDEVGLMDPYGKIILRRSYKLSGGGATVGCITPTRDGGCIYAVGVWDKMMRDTAWTIKVDKDFNEEWRLETKVNMSHSYAGASWIGQCFDGGYIQCSDGAMKMDATGHRTWEFKDGNYYRRIHQQRDSTFLMMGKTVTAARDQEIIITLLSQSGRKIWSKTYGGSHIEYPIEMALTSDGGAIISAYTASIDGDVRGNHGQEDQWILRLSNCLYQPGPDSPASIVQKPLAELYPTVTRSSFMLSAPDNEKISSLTIYNEQGKEVAFTVEMPGSAQRIIHLDNNLPGYYYVRLGLSGKTSIHKVFYAP